MVKPKIGAFAVIFNDAGHVLLCHRTDKDLWNLPGGGVEVGESPWQAVIREVKEEVCVDVDIIDLVGIYHFPDQDELVFSFICNIVGGELGLTNEADQIGWFSIDAWPDNTYDQHIERIKDALEFNGQVVLRN